MELLDGEGGLTVLSRDAAAKITSITSPLWAVTGYECDMRGRLVLRYSPGAGVSRYGYDKAGRLSFCQDFTDQPLECIGHLKPDG